MSFLGAGQQFTSAEAAVITALNQLGVTPSGQAIAKTGTASFANVTASGGTGTALAIGNSIASATVGSVLYVGTGTLLAQDNSNFSYTTSTKTLSLDSAGTNTGLHTGPAAGTTNAVVGGVGIEIVGTNNTIGGMNIILGNKSAGTSAFVDLFMQNNLADATGLHYAVLNYNSSTYSDTTFGTIIAVPNQVALYGTDGPTIIGSAAATVAGYVAFFTGGTDTSNERMRIVNGGSVTIGSTTATGMLNVGTAAQFQVSSTGNVTAGTYNKVTVTAPGTSATLTIANSSTLATTGTNTITLAGSGSNVFTFPSSSTTLVGTDTSQTLTNKTLTSPTIVTSLILPTGTIRGQVTARKTAAESFTTQTALQNDSHLSFAIAANEEWTAVFFLDAGAALSTTGIKLAITTPTSATQNITAGMDPDVFTALDAGYKRTTTSGTALDFTTTLSAGVANAGFVVSVWVLNGANAGTVQLQFAQSTSSGTAITLQKGSWMLATRIA